MQPMAGLTGASQMRQFGQHLWPVTKSLGPDYTSTLHTVNKVAEARTLYTRCQAGLEAVFGVRYDRYGSVT